MLDCVRGRSKVQAIQEGALSVVSSASQDSLFTESARVKKLHLWAVVMK